MASIKVKFRQLDGGSGEGSIFYQITHQRRIRIISTDYKILAEEWNEKHSQVVARSGSARMLLVRSISERIRCDAERIMKIYSKLELTMLSFTVDDIVEEYKRYLNDYSLFNFMEKIIIRKKSNGKIRTAETYISALNSFRRFRGGSDMLIDELTSEVVADYEVWLKGEGLIANSISFYMRILRAVYNRGWRKV